MAGLSQVGATGSMLQFFSCSTGRCKEAEAGKRNKPAKECREPSATKCRESSAKGAKGLSADKCTKSRSQQCRELR